LFLVSLYVLVSVPCARLRWPSRQLLSARKYIVSYRMCRTEYDNTIPRCVKGSSSNTVLYVRALLQTCSRKDETEDSESQMLLLITTWNHNFSERFWIILTILCSIYYHHPVMLLL